VLKRLSEQPAIDPSAAVENSWLGRYTETAARTIFAQSRPGGYSYIMNDGDVIYSDIGKFCSIASYVRLNPGNHPMERATQAHFTYRSPLYWPGEETDDEEFFAWRRSQPVTIGHDVWIGHGAIVLPGVSIGTVAVIAAGGVVTKDVPSYTVFAGVPARLIRCRFMPEVEEGLLKMAWWDWSHERLREALPDFRKLSAAEFVERYK
jgi:phosphonate metabolism protein (transferase hexapeptide repeat family)